MNYLKKHYLFIIIFLLSIYRFILSFNLESFYIYNFIYDDGLIINLLNHLHDGDYLGIYNQMTIIKGVIYPLFLYVIRSFNISYSVIFTLINIFTCLYFMLSLKKMINNKVVLLIMYIILLFNPVSYSSELFQRLYRNTLVIPELLLFLGTIIRIICMKKNTIIMVLYYSLLGIISAIMYLTREDNIWIVLGLLILFVFKIYSNRSIHSVLLCLIPISFICICLNIVSFINYKYYKTYTYNELSKSEFKKAYIKILTIKDDKKIEKVSITKSTFYKLVGHSKSFGLTREDIDEWYKHASGRDNEINNSNIIWKFRELIYNKFQFKNGKEANEYFHNLSLELDDLFDKGILKKEFSLPSVFMNPVTMNDIKKIPKSFFELVFYTSSYKDIKTIPNSYFVDNNYNSKMIGIKYDDNVKAYRFGYTSTHKTADIIDNNPKLYEIIRIIYKYFTIILSIPCLLIYLFNIKKKDKFNLILHIIMITYLTIVCGVTYTHVTAYDSIRYCYLGSVYILQNIFILLNIVRFYHNKKSNIIIDEK